MLAFHLLRPSALSIRHANLTKIQKRVTYSAFSRREMHSAACLRLQTLWDKQGSHALLMLCANSQVASAMIAQYVVKKRPKVEILVKNHQTFSLVTELKVGFCFLKKESFNRTASCLQPSRGLSTVRNTERLTRTRGTHAQEWYWTKLKFTYQDSSAIRLTELTTHQITTARQISLTFRYLSFTPQQKNARIKSCTMIRNLTAQSPRKKSYTDNTSTATPLTIIIDRQITIVLHLTLWVN